MPGEKSAQGKCPVIKVSGKINEKVPGIIIARKKKFQGKIVPKKKVPEEEVPEEINVRVKKVPWESAWGKCPGKKMPNEKSAT